MTFVSTRPLKVGEVVTMVWDQQNLKYFFCLSKSSQLSTERNITSEESCVSFNVYDEHLNLFVPDSMAINGHQYEYEQTHLAQKYDATKVSDQRLESVLKWSVVRKPPSCHLFVLEISR